MNKIIAKQQTDYSAYIGIILLYIKLFFIEPILVLEGIDVTFAVILLIIVLIRVFFKFTLLNINVFGFNKPAKRFWLFLLFSTLISFVLSPDIALGVVTVNVQIFLVYLIFIDFKSVNIDYSGLAKVINALTYFALLNAVLVFYTFFFGKIGLIGEVTTNDGNITRAFGIMGDQVAWFLTFFALHSLYTKKKYNFIIFLIAILMCASLGATIVLVVCIFVYFYREKRLNSSFYLKAGLGILLVVSALVFSPSLFEKIGILQRLNEGDFASTGVGNTTGHRFNAINNGLQMIPEKPLLGYQNFSLSMQRKYSNTITDAEKGNLTYLTTPNNQLLASICDYGFIGFFFFVGFIYKLIKITKEKCLELPPHLYAFKQSAIVWLVVFVIFNQSATWFLPGSFMWVLICLIVAINYKINQLYEAK